MNSFYELTPEKILDTVESALGSEKTGIRATGFAMALNSYENRVYEVGLDDETSVVTKFYRTNRWSSSQILEEHQFIARVKAAEVPAVAPLPLTSGKFAKVVDANQPTLGESSDGIFFAVFPKIKGRLLNELDDSQVRQMGRMLARLHNVGETLGPSTRPTLSVKTFLDEPLALLLASKFFDPNSRARFESVCLRLREKITPMLAKTKNIRVHGDCHLGNTLWSQKDGPFLLDFDDMRLGPVVQDIWMVLRGREEQAVKQRQEMLDAYEIFRPFPWEELSLIEPLRALRMIHYSSWIASRWDDPAFPRLFQNFGSPGYWQDEIQALEEIEGLIIPSYS